ncbi:hypothetical protein V2W45_1470843 [Cenococcum geophilum]
MRLSKSLTLYGNPLPEHLEALTRIWLSVLRLLNIIKDLPAKEIGELANKFKDFKVKLQLLPKGALFKQPPPKKKYGKANQRGKTSAKIAKYTANVAEDEQQPFNEPSVLYNEVLGGLKDEVVILEAGEDDNS